MNEVGGPAKVWIRQNLKSDQKLLIVGDGYPYYLLDYQMTQYSRYLDLEYQLAQEDHQKISKMIQNSNFRYLYLSNDSDYVLYRPKIARLMIYLDQHWNQKCELRKESGSSVWDLDCLNQVTTRG
jgi:hypothetical protein